MTDWSDSGHRIGRILTLVGDLLRELGDLVGTAQPQLPAARPAEIAQVVSSFDPPSAPVPTGPLGRSPESPVASTTPATPAPTPSPASVAPASATPESIASPAIPEAPAPIAPPAASSSPLVAAAPATDAGTADDELFLVCEQAGERVALPWSWVVGTRLSLEGSPEGFTLSDGHGERELQVGRVLGLYTRQEIAELDEPVHWIASVAEMPPSPVPEPSAPEPLGPRPPAPEPFPLRPAEPIRPTIALALEKHAREEPCPSPELRLAWIASPSALARRFLMRHLVDLGFEVHEARDLDDPMLPADLKGVAALFLDESLLEDWRTRLPVAAGPPPVVLLTVDGALSVPPDGTCPPQGAVLPRPFERSEVERVVAWLCSLRRGARSGGSAEHGDEEDDTWLFADPFGAARAGEHSGR